MLGLAVVKEEKCVLVAFCVPAPATAFLDLLPFFAPLVLAGDFATLSADSVDCGGATVSDLIDTLSTDAPTCLGCDAAGVTKCQVHRVSTQQKWFMRRHLSA